MSRIDRLMDLANESKVITPRHIQWVEQTRGEIMYTPEAIQYAVDVWNGKYKKAREGRFSPSSLGQCPRKIVLGYRGAPSEAIAVDSLDLMAGGTHLHLAWQMEGLSAGWLTAGETYVHDGHRLGGSMDGIVYDGSFFELKTMNSHTYRRLVTNKEGPTHHHLLQIEAYRRCSGRDECSLLYQNRDFGDTHEFRIKPDPQIKDDLDKILDKLNGHVDIDTLPKMLSDCESQEGVEYNQCNVRKECFRLAREEMDV